MKRTKPTPAALRKRAELARKRAAGLKRIELWIDPRIERTVRAAVKRAFGELKERQHTPVSSSSAKKMGYFARPRTAWLEWTGRGMAWRGSAWRGNARQDNARSLADKKTPRH